MFINCSKNSTRANTAIPFCIRRGSVQKLQEAVAKIFLMNSSLRPPTTRISSLLGRVLSPKKISLSEINEALLDKFGLHKAQQIESVNSETRKNMTEFELAQALHCDKSYVQFQGNSIRNNPINFHTDYVPISDRWCTCALR